MPGAAPPTNSLPAEHHVLAGGSIGHILRNRSINVAGIVPTATDRWFHYDQVGSVMATTNATGALSELRHPDAFGNRMASWQSGLWTNTYAERKGWGHNTKEFDADTGLVYMYQRWYNPELGLFGSKAPYEPMREHQFGFASGQPSSRLDFDGRIDLDWRHPDEFMSMPQEHELFCWDPRAYVTDLANANGKSDKWKHCMVSCIHSKCMGGLAPGLALIPQIAWEVYTGGGAGGVSDAIADTGASARGAYGAAFCPNKSCEEICGGLM